MEIHGNPRIFRGRPAPGLPKSSKIRIWDVRKLGQLLMIPRIPGILLAAKKSDFCDFFGLPPTTPPPMVFFRFASNAAKMFTFP